MKLGLKVGAPLVAVILGAGAFHDPTPSLAFADAGAILAAPLPEACTGQCFECQLGPGHVAGTVDECPECTLTHKQGGGWHPTTCTGASNCGNHDGCEEVGGGMDTVTAAEVAAVDSRDLFVQVSRAVANEDGESLQQLLVANPRRLRYVADRGAVQIIAACDGDVIAHYPVASRVATLLD
jgi:hypothetical protein